MERDLRRYDPSKSLYSQRWPIKPSAHLDEKTNKRNVTLQFRPCDARNDIRLPPPPKKKRKEEEIPYEERNVRPPLTASSHLTI